MFKIIVTGGKDFKDFNLMSTKLDKLTSGGSSNGIEIHTTDRRGTEKLVKKWAYKRDVPVQIHKVNWNNGRLAGAKVMTQMLAECDAIVIFDNGEDSFIQNLINRTASLHIQRRVIKYESTELWSQKPVTEKQMAVIAQIRSNRPTAPAFTGTTVAEAGIYIRRYY